MQQQGNPNTAENQGSQNNDTDNSANKHASSNSDPTASAEPTPTPTPGPTGQQQRRPAEEFWCHQCQRQITPMMVPDPMCPHCHGEFVEKIEADNDPRAFAQPDPRTGNPSADRDGRQGPDLSQPVNVDDLFRLFQLISNPRALQQQLEQQNQQHQQRIPGQPYGTDFQIIFNSGPMGSTRTFTTASPGIVRGMGGQPPPQQQQQQQQQPHPQPQPQQQQQQRQQSPPSQSHAAGGRNEGEGAGQQAGSGPQWHSPPGFISSLLGRLGIELHYTTDPAALGHGPMGNPMAGFLPIVGNPGDYAWGQGGLDDIITRMMELQNRQNGPVGATDEIIDSIPHHKLTDEEFEAKKECSVCKDEFTKEDNLLQLPCKHIFHEDCIKPWLKVSGTCPTCRFSLVGGNDSEHAGQNSSSSSRNAAAGHTTASAPAPTSLAAAAGAPSTDLPGAFPVAPSNTAATNNSNPSSELPEMEPLD